MHSSGRLIGPVLMAAGLFCLTTPVWAGEWAVALIGIGLGVAGLGRAIAAFRRGAAWGELAAALGLALVGVLLLSAGNLVAGALGRLLALVALAEAARRLWHLRRPEGRALWLSEGLGALLALAIAALAWALSGNVPLLAGVVAGAALILSGWEIWLRPAALAQDAAPARETHPDAGLALDPGADLGVLHDALTRTNPLRSGDTLAWLGYFALLLFTIHAVRMQADLSLPGLIPALTATLGDLLIALLAFWALILPLRLLWRRLTRRIERRLWQERRAQSGAMRRGAGGVADRLTAAWLDGRYRFGFKLQRSRASLGDGLSMALGNGLIVAALLVAINSIWGFSWYFNTENWASGVYQAVTGPRVDDWRAAMALAVTRDSGQSPDQAFALHPAGTEGDFSFLVIGDPGEGDPSQLVLKDQILAQAGDPAVKFVLISSDVIYPAGEMKDYERNFYLPFKGLTQPIYAIPGNHDWFNALDAFNANLLTPEAALAAMRARVARDGGLTLVSDGQRQAMVAEAARLRELYGLNSGLQKAPYFDIQTDSFALIAVDTGVMKTLDTVQMDWLQSRLQAAQGKFTMVLLGHPRYAGGQDTAPPGSDFRALYDLLERAGVAVAMAGDTHDFEYYRQPVPGPRGAIHHFLNGGGGAYLSIGTALDWPAAPATAEWAYYPSTAAVTEKMNAETPGWKWPVWQWIRWARAWPVSVETLSGIFDFNKAPFFQSVMAVDVLPSQGVVRFRLIGQDGPLHWRDLQTGLALPEGATPDDPVVIALPLSAAG